jgi:hypothetical protein
MKFELRKPLFGTKTSEGIPSPIITRAKARSTAQIAEAADLLKVMPREGESLHAIQTGRFDLMTMVSVIVAKIGGCDEVRLATLSFNRANLAEMLNLIDTDAAGKVTLLCSAFFRANNKDLWAEALEEFRDRGQRAAAARSHCKVVTLAARDGRRLSLEGSANLRTNSNREQFALTQDTPIHDWHAAWIDELVSRHEGEAHADR